MGLGGNDILRGGAGSDDLCGGAGNDRLYFSGCTAGSCPGSNLGDFLSGGGGIDQADYSTAGAAVVVCLDPTDVTCTAGPQNGVAGAVDIINDTSQTACPGARVFKIACGAGYNDYTPGGVSYTCGTATYNSVAAGGAMANDVVNLTGPSAGSTLNCGTLSCTVTGGAGDDTITGSPHIDQIFGNGGSDTVMSFGGADLIDLSNTAAGPFAPQVDCNGDPVVLVLSANDQAGLLCGDGSGGYAVDCGPAPAAANTCSVAKFR
jgi:Ca2+-binding RTX toxin-like protein